MWVDSPCPDSIDATWPNVWDLFRRTLRCSLVGHRFTEYRHGPLDGEWDFKTCERCYRVWDWRPAA